ncbi:bone morphogenetic protein 7-like [Biomphalaria glabrata]|uniref:Bone morphogenetic protein 7-like n=1 Tax=Biomphalaria glabrata TaxID=6526 RepID=A0A9W2Z7E9_BIOGL|nr:bone morphogenetic protein 7-like [Biomphalaria glabrata]XP_055870909.1 bone morphogenetic protein 7-like [Biomphalaria glabrata]
MKRIFSCLCMLTTWLLSSSTATFYTDNDLGQSVPMGKIEPRQQEKLQQELLELMGLYSKPKSKAINKSIKSAAKFMQDLYRSLRELDGSDFTTDDSHIHINSSINASVLGLDPAKVEGSDVIVSFVNNVKKAHIRHEKDKAFYFDFSEVSVGEQLKGAEFRLYKDVAPILKSGTFNVSIYAIKPGDDWEEKILEYQSSLTVDHAKNGWIILDATRIAEHWTHFPHLNMGLYLKVTDSFGKEFEPKDIGIVGHKGPADKQPFLVGYMYMIKEVLSRRIRSLRSARWATTSSDDVTLADNPYTEYSRPSNTRYRSHNNCQRHPLQINFRDIGFGSEFLIAPEGYSAFFCDGDCSFPLGIHMNATNHAIVQTLVHLMTPSEAPKPCCAPTKFGPITLLYYDDSSSVILKRFKDMIVKACGCL